MNQISAAPQTAVAIASDDELIRVLGRSLYPNAKPESIALVLGYCRAAGLDPMLKPVHIVPMWDSKARVERDVIMPGIGHYRVQASRSGQYVGKSEPEYGPEVREKFGTLEVVYPEWCKITVRRSIGGYVADFTATEYWRENYATAGRDTAAPNAMWKKRPRGQLAKVAEAQALRMAFPELIGAETAEEMEGKDLAADMRDVTPTPASDKKTKKNARAQLDTFANVKPKTDEPPHDAMTGEVLPDDGTPALPEMPAAAKEAWADGKWAKGWKWFQTTLPTIDQKNRAFFWKLHTKLLTVVAAYNADAKAAVEALAQEMGVTLDDHEAG
ncbi:bet_lambda, phage recombination protein Bet [uncultured Caudovirales phage]|uniref:Bet_lambda, phage recombination protein Bet n=1 Tax=uncultured Caudovirales phage TaxID=2100421 RepID=A0A6J7WQ75_9CAUD|nr:bet_lambda, phage recombination protein Bet [uncultured Caudovirales phage]